MAGRISGGLLRILIPFYVGHLYKISVLPLKTYRDSPSELRPVSAGKVGPGIHSCVAEQDELTFRERNLLFPYIAAGNKIIQPGFLESLTFASPPSLLYFAPSIPILPKLRIIDTPRFCKI
jgi:hypothetical protein